MKRIRNTFEALRTAGKKALIPYITPEFPQKGMTVPLLLALEEAGADLIEIGIPFSDPLADGETIQRSSEIALQNGATIGTILRDVREFRKGSDLPLLLMGYMNPILRFGAEKFLAASHDAGVDGVIIPDLPPEEATEFRQGSERHGVSNVFLIAPTTPVPRIQQIDTLSTDFSYCVSMRGVTGAQAGLGEDGSFEEFLRTVRANTKKPFVVGFGISKQEQVATVWRFADGAVVGSALLRVVGSCRSPGEAAASAKQFLLSLRPT
ncbi:MAG: tryptophan synthase subunit alpha [Bacteroidota bacterium]